MEEFKRDGYENATFFIGPEIEQTTAFGKKTLFVRDLQDTTLVKRLANKYKVSHIFIGVSRSFDSLALKDGVYMVGDTLASDWDKQIHHLLDCGFLVTLDYPAHKHYHVLKVLNLGIWQSRNFIPMLAVPIPHVQTSNVNLTVKIDDANFGETNPGVWCMNHSEVTDSNRFTSWNEYIDDVILTDDDIAEIAAPVAAPLAAPVVTPVRTSFAEIVKPVVNLEKAKEIIEAKTPDLNPQDIGLDPDSASKLKPDPDAVTEKPAVSTLDAAAAYADDSVSPAAKKVPKKSKAQNEEV